LTSGVAGWRLNIETFFIVPALVETLPCPPDGGTRLPSFIYPHPACILEREREYPPIIGRILFLNCINMADTMFSKNLAETHQKAEGAKETRAEHKAVEDLMTAIGLQAKYNAVREAYNNGVFSGKALPTADFLLGSESATHSGDCIKLYKDEDFPALRNLSTGVHTKVETEELFLALLTDLANIAMSERDDEILNIKKCKVIKGENDQAIFMTRKRLAEAAIKKVIDAMYGWSENYKQEKAQVK